MVLLLGSNGYVGRCFADYLKSRKVEVVTIPRAEQDYTDAATLRKLLREYRPEFLINAAGYTGKPNVDACENSRADTLFGNTVFPLRVAEVCAEESITWGHVSSGCIYQGAKSVDAAGRSIGFREEDVPNFSFHAGDCSFYSGTKALAEEYLVKYPGPLYIWRLRVPFDNRDNGRNYLTKLLRYKRLLDVRNSLSHLTDFVASAWATLERHLPNGVYNLTNPGAVTTREVVGLIQQEGERRLKAGDESGRRMLKNFVYFDSEDEFMKTMAVARRSSCVLDTAKAEGFGLPLRPVHEALTDSLQRWVWEAAS
jgi:dTDP-4-dehydrorhamnose reductase